MLPGQERPWWVIKTGAVWWSVGLADSGRDLDPVGAAVPSSSIREALLLVHGDVKSVRCYDPPMLKTYMAKKCKTMFVATAVTREHRDGRVVLESVRIVGDHYWNDSYDAAVWSSRASRDLDEATRAAIVDAIIGDYRHDSPTLLLPALDLDDAWCGMCGAKSRWNFEFEDESMPVHHMSKKRQRPE
jgi:hypothetical protein